ncbi:MAG: hypothetical protein O2779_02070, partial [Nanoarchaeota archaeon]|nr:hypothetical protein [Nanoarchaeota archaeon]
ALDDIKKLASELYQGTQVSRKLLPAEDITEISEEIRKKIHLLYPTAHKAWFHFDNKSIDERTEIMLKLHKKLEEIYKEGAFLVENKDRILARIKRLFPAGSKNEKGTLGPQLRYLEKSIPIESDESDVERLDIAA